MRPHVQMFMVVLIAMATSCAMCMGQDGRSSAMSPFDAVEWEGEPGSDGGIVRVQVGEQWFELEAIDGLPLADILSGIESHYGRRDLVKRFEEDLIEALAKLGLKVEKEARLRVRGEDGEASHEIVSEWTRARRQALREASRERLSAPRDAALNAAEALSTLDALEHLIERHSAYAVAAANGAKGKAWRALLNEARERAAVINTRSALTMEVRRIVAAIGDAHASVNGVEAESARWLPFLPVASGVASGPILAVRADRGGFVAEKTPVVMDIDGAPIERWIAAARERVPDASAQLVWDRVCRELRDVESLRRIAAPDAVGKSTVRIGLADSGGAMRSEVELRLSVTKPIYGEWPEAASRLLTEPGGSPIGYVRLARMDGKGALAVKQFVEEYRDAGADVLVVDVRGNGGGSRDALYALAGAIMTPESQSLVINAARPLLVDGVVSSEAIERLHRRGLKREDDPTWSESEQRAIEAFRRKFVPAIVLPDSHFDRWWFACVNPVVGEVAERWNGKVIVVQDAACFSATDVFLAAMKALPGVTLVGEVSGGGSGAAIEHELTKGIKVRLSSMVSFQPSGQLFDGVGVEPHVIIERQPADALRGDDRWLRQVLQLARERQ